MFEEIKKDPYIIELYSKIENPTYNKRFWTYHGLRHVNNVIEMVEKILLQFGCNDEYIESAKIAALMHDLGMIDGKENHDIKSYEIASKYFADYKINLKYKNEILEAIKSHRSIDNSNSMMAVVLLFADKIDIKKTRLAPDGYNIVGLRQYQYIDDINISKDENSLIVQFIINNACNNQELEEWYFTTKVFSAIQTFANHFGLTYKILWNNQEWILEETKKLIKNN